MNIKKKMLASIVGNRWMVSTYRGFNEFRRDLRLGGRSLCEVKNPYRSISEADGHKTAPN